MNSFPLLRLLAIAVAVITTSVSLNAAAERVLKPHTATRTKDDTIGGEMAPYKGVKHALGVLDFETDAGAGSWWQLGRNLREMLESALFATDRFIIVDRGQLSGVLAEQDLQASGRAAAGAKVAQTGKIRSARFLASGSVTEVSDETSGEGAGVNIGGIRLGGKSQRVAIVTVVKLVDATTGEVIASERIRGNAGRTGVKIGYSGHDFSGDLGAFAKTPMGEAAQDCINQAVKFICEEMEDQPVQGAVVAASEEEIIINLGKNYGISEGQTFIVRKVGEELTDPDTGEVLARRKGEKTASIEVIEVDDKTSTCKLVDGTIPERGEIVVLDN